MKEILAIVCGLCTGIVVYIATPHVQQWVKAYLKRIARKVDPILNEVNWDLSPIKRTLFYAIGPIASIIISIIIFKQVWIIILVAVILSILTYNLSYRIVIHLKKRRINAVKKQLVDALSLVSNALRSGLSLQQGFQMVGEEMPPPISQEFQMVASSQQLGKTFDAALMELKERVPLEEIERLSDQRPALFPRGGAVFNISRIHNAPISTQDRMGLDRVHVVASSDGYLRNEEDRDHQGIGQR
jgi:Flp pilus assembly protein TadB